MGWYLKNMAQRSYGLVLKEYGTEFIWAGTYKNMAQSSYGLVLKESGTEFIWSGT